MPGKSFHLAPLGHSLLKPGCCMVKKPRSHAEAMYRLFQLTAQMRSCPNASTNGHIFE